jgi:hypothetical protein
MEDSSETEIESLLFYFRRRGERSEPEDFIVCLLRGLESS